MRMATTYEHIVAHGLGAAPQARRASPAPASRAGPREGGWRCLRPAVGFLHPRDVLKDPLLDAAEKRAVLASWASDASAVQDEPTLRWLLGTPEPVPLADVREALDRLDRLEGAGHA